MSWIVRNYYDSSIGVSMAKIEIQIGANKLARAANALARVEQRQENELPEVFIRRILMEVLNRKLKAGQEIIVREQSAIEDFEIS